MSILPGQLAFSFVMTIIPVIVLIAVIASTFQISLDSITEFIKISFPEGVSTLLLPLINGRGFDLSILTFLIAALWLASTGAYAVITASDVIYEVKSKNAIAKRIKSIVMIFLLLALIMFMLIVPAFGDKIFNLIISLKREGKIIFIVSHDIDLLYKISDNVIGLSNGKLVINSKKEDAFNDLKLLIDNNIPIPKIVLFETLVKYKKNIKLMHTYSINDLIKEVYRNV